MYKFRKANQEEANEMFKMQYAGRGIYNGVTERKFALFLGQMIALFGDSGNMSADWENMYSYSIIAEDEHGKSLLLEVYHGSGGPSIAIPTEHNKTDLMPYEQAEKELVAYIENAVPADYEWDSVYEDVGINIKYSVKDGKACVTSEFPEDFEDM